MSRRRSDSAQPRSFRLLWCSCLRWAHTKLYRYAALKLTPISTAMLTVWGLKNMSTETLRYCNNFFWYSFYNSRFGQYFNKNVSIKFTFRLYLRIAHSEGDRCISTLMGSLAFFWELLTMHMYMWREISYGSLVLRSCPLIELSCG